MIFVPPIAVQSTTHRLTLYFFARNATNTKESQDSIMVALTKLASGYLLGKIWAFAIHYILHFPSLYRFHRQHHCNPKTLVASRAWQDSYVEYAIMELPSFALTILCFPTHFWALSLHFVFHGYDGAAGHSGFCAPGWIGFLTDGTYHYHHHAHLTVNYAEVEIFDKLCGTHHTQQPPKKSFHHH